MNAPTLPNSQLGRTTETAGFFEASARAVADWLADALGSEWQSTVVSERVLADHVGELLAGGSIRTYLLFELVGGWTLLCTDGPLGTDPGVLPSRFAMQCGARAIRATVASGADNGYPACILEVFDPGADDQQRCRRHVYAANDGGRWKFGQYGVPFPFEDVEAYERRLVRARLTPAMISDYLAALGVAAPGLGAVGPAVVVART